MGKGIGPAAALCALLGAAALVAGCGGSSNPKPTALNVSIGEQGKTASFQAPKTSKGGLVEVTLANHGKAPHGVQFIRYTSGHAAADVQKQLGSNTNKIPDWLKAEGGIGSVAPGATQTATLNLPAGNYVLVDAAALGGGGPSSGPPATADMTVSSGETGDLPDTPGKVVADQTGKDQFAWDVSGLKAGENDITFESKGEDSLHLLIAVPVKGTAPPLSQIKSDIAKNGPPPPYLDVKNIVSSAVLDGGLSQTTKLDLQKPGQYVFFCPLTDRDGGKPHDQEGLLAVETVK